MNPNYGNLDVHYNNRFIRFEDHTAYESRNPSMMKLIKSAWDMRIANDGPEEEVRFFRLFTDDMFNPHCHYSFSARNIEESRRSMPNFIFDSWPQCGITSYEEVFEEMVRSGSEPYKDDRVFWIGNTANEVAAYETRRMGLEVARKHPDMFDCRSISWQRGPFLLSWRSMTGAASSSPEDYKPVYNKWRPEDNERVNATPGYVTLPYHCRYRVLIDFGGVGFSARIPLLLASGRPLIIVGHREEAWFYWDGTLVPWEHYIPCGGKEGQGVNESSLFETLKWTFKNPEICESIGRSGMEYARRYLTRSAALARIGEMMAKHFNG